MKIIGAEIETRLGWDGICAAFEAGHRLPRAVVEDTFLYRGADTLLNRAAWIDGLGQLTKCATIFPGNTAHGLPSVNGAVTLYDDRTGVLTALVDFHLVTRWKTAGDSLFAARRLARPESRNILLVGSGAVARSMVAAYGSTFADARFSVWSRNPSSARAFADATGAAVADDLAAAVSAADIICTATMSTRPLIQGEWLRPGQHLDLIGAYTPAMREVDDAALKRGRLFVDARATTVHHIGEIRDPLARGVITEADIIADYYDDPDLYRRLSGDEITIAKNGGGAHLDLMTADWIARSAA